LDGDAHIFVILSEAKDLVPIANRMLIAPP
jgi:hypothetical protein